VFLLLAEFGLPSNFVKVRLSGVKKRPMAASSQAKVKFENTKTLRLFIF
jgi:hypothetical protein